MKIQVDFYKDTGKWYAGGIVDVGDAKVYSDDLEQAIVSNQGIMADGWQNSDYYYVVTNNVDDNDDFCMRLYKQGSFKGLRR